MTQKKILIHKSGSSNLVADKTKSIVKLIIFVFSIVLKDVLTNENNENIHLFLSIRGIARVPQV